MSPDQIYVALRNQVLATLPELTPEEVTPDADMETLGANSLDRLDIITCTLEDINANVSMSRLAGTKSLDELARIIHEHIG